MFDIEDFGRYMVGQDLFLWLRCRGANAQNVVPDEAPLATILDDAGDVIWGPTAIPPIDRGRTDGLFRGRLFLGPDFSAGHYSVSFTWLWSTVTYGSDATFEITEGGNSDGRIIGLYCYERPYANHLVMHTTRGILASGRNPSL